MRGDGEVGVTEVCQRENTGGSTYDGPGGRNRWVVFSGSTVIVQVLCYFALL